MNRCIDCHFLTVFIRRHALVRTMSGGATAQAVDTSRTWTERERKGMALEDADGATVGCWKGIWTEHTPDPLEGDDILHQDRGDDCFFVEVQEGMSFEAADNLFQLKRQHRQLMMSYRYTQVGLWVAAIGIALSTLFSILEFFKPN